MNNIGEKVRELRQQSRMTLEDVAKHLGITRATAQRYESGVIKIPSDKIEMLAKLFQVSPGYFFGWMSLENPSRPVHPEVTGMLTERIGTVNNDREFDLLSIYRSLSEEGKTYLLKQAEIAQKIYGVENEE